MDAKAPLLYTLRVPRIIRGTNRVGHQCEALKTRHNQVHIRFTDGTEAVVSRFLLRRLPESGIVSPPPEMPV